MDDKYNHDAVMKIIEKQKLIADHSKGMRDKFFWANGVALLCSPSLDNVPGDAWDELPQNSNVEKWAEKLFSKTTSLLPHMSGHVGIVGAIASAVIAKTNDCRRIMDKAKRLANLEWQLQHLTYWSAPTHEPNKKRKTYVELSRQRELLRDSAIEALCLYQCGAHDFLNDFERYNSHSVGDIYCAKQYESAFNKMMVEAVTYCTAFGESEKNANNRRGQTAKNNCLTLWLKERLSDNPDCKPESLWLLISKDKENATEAPDLGEMWISGWSEGNEGRLHITDCNGKTDKEGITFKTFKNRLSSAKNNK